MSGIVDFILLYADHFYIPLSVEMCSETQVIGHCLILLDLAPKICFVGLEVNVV